MKNNIKHGSTVYADEHHAYDALDRIYNIKRINHSGCYSTRESCTNFAEGWFSRLRRAEIRQFHHVAGKYLYAYANEMAFRKDYKRKDNGSVLLVLTDRCLKTQTSRDWSGYWQGNKQQGGVMIAT
ncbi:hypothetical protein [uncultured Gammaproteobacteria bacterium]|nr:hypothetical protein [uncultured Gammaproteobacteria bacterium]